MSIRTRLRETFGEVIHTVAVEGRQKTDGETRTVRIRRCFSELGHLAMVELGDLV